ncbi:MAG: SusD/RagB family nutrient-binding outer membrane lipoprotein [Bacteroidota bacterium]
MKKYKLTSVLIFILILSFGCTEGWVKMNEDPNNAIDVPAANILTYVERASSETLWDVWWTGNNTSSYANHISKIQYIDENRYYEREGIIARWGTLMSYQTDLKKIIAKAQDPEDPNAKMEGVAKVLSAFLYHIMTDTYKAIPFTEGAQGEIGVLAPGYDDQPTVYAGILDMLAEANTLLAQDGTIDGDILNGNDALLWQKFANSLRLRVAIRMSNVDPTGAGNVISTILSNPATYPILSSNDDMIALKWTESSPYREPFYEDQIGRDDHGMCDTFIDALLHTNDPRIGEFAHPAPADDVYRGLVAGIAEEDEGFGISTISRIGTRYRDIPDGLTYWMRYAEIEFIKAEAYERGLATGDAQAAYEAGVTASCEEHGVSAGNITTYLADPNVAWDDNTGDYGYSNLEKIYFQKWISLFKQGHEAWAETRRTDIPLLDAAPGSLYPGHNRPPFRWPYPKNEYNLNPGVPDNWDGDIEDEFWGDQMWWDTRTGVQ